jgi:hypothetical protein
MTNEPADKRCARVVITSRCERCGAGLVILCDRKLEEERSYVFPCPGCHERLERRLPCEFMEARKAATT